MLLCLQEQPSFEKNSFFPPCLSPFHFWFGLGLLFFLHLPPWVSGSSLQAHNTQLCSPYLCVCFWLFTPQEICVQDKAPAWGNPVSPTLQLFVVGMPVRFCPSGSPADRHILVFFTPWKSEVKIWVLYTISTNTGGFTTALWFCCGQAHFHFHMVEENVVSGFCPENPGLKVCVMYLKVTAHTRMKTISRKKNWDKTTSQRHLLGLQNGLRPWTSGCSELERSGVQSPCGFRGVHGHLRAGSHISAFPALVPGIAAFSSTSQ